MNNKIHFELEPINAITILSMMQEIMAKYKLHPRYINCINDYHIQLRESITDSQMEEIDIQMELDRILNNNGIEIEYKTSGVKLCNNDNTFTDHLEREYYDEEIYDTIADAREAGQIYIVYYFQQMMYVIDPDGLTVAINLIAPIDNNGIDIRDVAKLRDYLEADMRKRR